MPQFLNRPRRRSRYRVPRGDATRRSEREPAQGLTIDKVVHNDS
jgi:hypothetical protein